MPIIWRICTRVYLSRLEGAVKCRVCGGIYYVSDAHDFGAGSTRFGMVNQATVDQLPYWNCYVCARRLVENQPHPQWFQSKLPQAQSTRDPHFDRPRLAVITIFLV